MLRLKHIHIFILQVIRTVNDKVYFYVVIFHCIYSPYQNTTLCAYSPADSASSGTSPKNLLPKFYIHIL